VPNSSTCLETFSTLRIFSEDISPDVIGSILGVEATKKRPRDLSSPYRPRRETNYWEWCTSESVAAPDNMVHLQAIVARLLPRRDALKRLQDQGCQTDITNYWVSAGQGGPSLSAATMQALVQLDLSISWDVYFEREPDMAGDRGSDA
jgi:hypothetical protein